MVDEHTAKEGVLNPQKVLEQLEVGDAMQIADFGCGHGYFSVPIAQIAQHGLVYCFDVVEEELDALRSRAHLQNVANIRDIRANLETPGGSKLADGSIDMVMVANILFQSQQKEKILKEAVRVLKSNGKLVLIDWMFGASLAPAGGWALSKEDAMKLAKAAGLIFEKEIDAGNQHYGLIFKK